MNGDSLGFEVGLFEVARDMKILVNQETVNDTAKLIMHRLISRQIGRDPSLVDRAKVSHAQTARLYAGRPFVREWDDLLKLQPTRLRAKLVSRESDMVRLRASSPFPLTAGIDFTDYDLRLRIRRAAGRIVKRGLTCGSRLSDPIT
jgi:hypothetical protein